MSHEKDGREKSGKKAPAKSLKEKRAAKAARRHGLESPGKIVLTNPVPKTGKP